MQVHRNDEGDLERREAGWPPPVSGRVHGLGECDALRVDFEPVQLPWLANEIDTLYGCVEDELARIRARHDQLTTDATAGRSPAATEPEDELDRWAYQLEVLRMIREQVPVRRPVAEACVASPWDDLGELALELAGITAPVTVVGPAQGMRVLIRGAARNAADALGEALRLSDRDVAEHGVGTAATSWPELHGLTASVAYRLRDLAAAAEAFTEDYVDRNRGVGDGATDRGEGPAVAKVVKQTDRDLDLGRVPQIRVVATGRHVSRSERLAVHDHPFRSHQYRGGLRRAAQIPAVPCRYGIGQRLPVRHPRRRDSCHHPSRSAGDAPESRPSGAVPGGDRGR